MLKPWSVGCEALAASETIGQAAQMFGPLKQAGSVGSHEG